MCEVYLSTHSVSCAAFSNEAWAGPLQGEVEQRSKVSAEIKVHAPADVLWDVLTDFSSHVHLMPNVEQCEQVPSGRPNTALFIQKVFSQTPFWRVEASAMLEYRQKRAESWRKMNFRMLSGDFAELSGHWVVAEDHSTPLHSILRYEIVFMPLCEAAIPCAMKQFLAKQVLPCNIMALAAHAEQLAQVTLPSFLGFKCYCGPAISTPRDIRVLATSRSSCRGAGHVAGSLGRLRHPILGQGLTFQTT